FAFTARGQASIVGLSASDLTAQGSVDLTAGTAAGPVNEQIAVSFTDTITISLPSAGAFKVSGNLKLKTPGGTLNGDFTVSKSTAGPDGVAGNADDRPEVLIGATNASIFLGSGDMTDDVSDDIGIRVSGASVFFILGASSGPSRYAFSMVGNVGLVG